MTYMNAATYWQKVELIVSMLSVLTIVFAIHFVFVIEKSSMWY